MIGPDEEVYLKICIHVSDSLWRCECPSGAAFVIHTIGCLRALGNRETLLQPWQARKAQKAACLSLSLRYNENETCSHAVDGPKYPKTSKKKQFCPFY